MMTEPTFTIRGATEDDYEGVHAILTSPHIMQGTLRVPLASTDYSKARLSPRNGVHQIVAVDNETEEIVGFGELITTPDEPRARHAGEIDLVAVSEESQSQGVGSALMDSMIDLADNWLDLKRLSLIAFVGNDRAIALYERLGFEREGIMRRVGYGDGDWMDAVMMARLRD
jgi:putative acetyltransferase